MNIRIETADDYAEVNALVAEAFATAPYGDGTEAEYLSHVRKSSSFIPELSLVAVEDGQILGQIVLYKTEIKYPDRIDTQLVLSPLSVRLGHFRRGIGTSLIYDGCKRALDMGYRAVFLCGDKNYYSRFGFVPAVKYGIRHKSDPEATAEWCMVKELENGYLRQHGGVVDVE